jgi:hypothetical protein
VTCLGCLFVLTDIQEPSHEELKRPESTSLYRGLTSGPPLILQVRSENNFVNAVLIEQLSMM